MASQQEDGAESEENVSTDSQSEAASATLSSQSSRQKSTHSQGRV